MLECVLVKKLVAIWLKCIVVKAFISEWAWLERAMAIKLVSAWRRGTNVYFRMAGMYHGHKVRFPMA
jgi:hypothetical protein